MSQNFYLPRFRDQEAPEPADRRPPPNRDPDGTLLAAEDATLLAAKPYNVSTAHQAEPMAFDVMAIENTTTGNSNEDNDTASNTINKNNSFPWMAAIASFTIIVVAVIAGVVVGVVCGTGDCGGTSDPSATTSTRSQDITNLINSKSYKGVDLSPTGTSPEERALQWLIDDDPLQLNVGAEVDEFRLLQRYSLLTLWFQGDTGTTWINSAYWLNADECTWFGITCQSGVATEVNFHNNGFQGSLSPDLGLLTDITNLEIVEGLSGSLPSEIGLWTNLEMIDVNYNLLNGSLPSEIGLWTNLEWFSVANNLLTGTIPATIANWKLIESGNFQGNDLSGSMPDGICEFFTGPLWADCNLPCSCCTACA